MGIRVRLIGDPTPLLVGGSPIAAEALTARLAKAAVATVSEREGVSPRAITVTHPAAWGPFKLDLLRQAMRMADLTDVRYLSEPEAAAWEYAATRPLEPGGTIAVYALGGGTFDATLLRAGENRFSVLGEPEAIERFGGPGFDGEYLTGDVSSDYLAGIEASRLDGESNGGTRLSSYQLDLGLTAVD